MNVQIYPCGGARCSDAGCADCGGDTSAWEVNPGPANEWHTSALPEGGPLIPSEIECRRDGRDHLPLRWKPSDGSWRTPAGFLGIMPNTVLPSDLTGWRWVTRPAEDVPEAVPAEDVPANCCRVCEAPESDHPRRGNACAAFVEQPTTDWQARYEDQRKRGDRLMGERDGLRKEADFFDAERIKVVGELEAERLAHEATREDRAKWHLEWAGEYEAHEATRQLLRDEVAAHAAEVRGWQAMVKRLEGDAEEHEGTVEANVDLRAEAERVSAFVTKEMAHEYDIAGEYATLRAGQLLRAASKGPAALLALVDGEGS